MAGKKKPKKAAAKKPAKKAAPKKGAKSAKAAKAKKAAPKKAAPKKAASKAAPKKKPAAKKPAAKKPRKEAPAPEPAEAIEVIEADLVESTEPESVSDDAGGDDGDDGDAGGDEGDADAESDRGGSLRSEILAVAKQLYGDRSDEELLEFDPNTVDAMDPNNFYELISEKYGVAFDDSDENFGGFGGPIKKTIEFVDARWDGETRKDTPMPPGDWLEEHVRPESEA